VEAKLRQCPAAFLGSELCEKRTMPFSKLSASRELRVGQSLSRRLLRRRLLRWYDVHKRDLPWRSSRDPYRIWLSEVMLQQTRVAVVTEYYERFLERFPTIRELAAAPLASVLAAWSGLGYYRRARMLHETAQRIVKERGGVFPKTTEELRNLPGIGRYTAAAIASIAFDEPAAVVDGNVARLLQRVLGRKATSEELWAITRGLLSRSRPGDFNQAIMELGATVCLPGEPRCAACPLLELCAAKGRLAESEKENRRKREIYYALARRNGSIFLVQRPAGASLMPDMWELPEITVDSGVPGVTEQRLTLRHSITVTDYRVHVLQQGPPPGIKGRWVAGSRLSNLPLTGLGRKILRAAGII
jgi:A/G-specific adenine glycosylase